MKNLLTLILFVLIFHSIQSQSDPTALLEKRQFLDVTEMDGITYVATIEKLFKIYPDGYTEDIVSISSNQYYEGRFYQKEDHWTYVGVHDNKGDYSGHAFTIKHYDGKTLKEHFIGDITWREFYELVIGVTYVNDDSIFILTKRFEDYKVRQYNIESELINTIEIEVPKVNDFILLNDNSHLIVCQSELFLLKGNELTTIYRAESNRIYDVSYYPKTGQLDVLQKDEIWKLNEDFEIIDGKFYTRVDERRPQAIYSNDSTYFVLEVEGFNSFIRAFGYGMKYEYKERGGIKYKNIKIIGNNYFMWGSNLCPFGNFMKIDIDGVDYQVPTINLSIDNFIVDLVSYTLHSGSQSVSHDYAWSFDVTNLSDKKVDSFSIESNVLNYTLKPINIKDHDGLMVGEKRSYEGSFTIVRYQYSHPNYLFAGLKTYELDSDCSDNSASSGELLTTIKEEELFDRFLLFPNPTSDYLNVSPNESFRYKIFDSTGQLLIDQYTAGNNQIDVESLKPGLFYIQIQLENESITYNFIKI